MKESYELIWKLIDRSITGEEFEQLQEALSESAELRRFYQESLETEESLRGIDLNLAGDSLMEKRRWGGWKVAKWGIGVGGALAACLAVIFSLPDESTEIDRPSLVKDPQRNFQFTPWDSGRDEKETSALAAEIRERALWAASITAVGGVGDGSKIALPYALTGGILKVTEGWVEVTFEESAVVRLEAPTTFEIISASSGYLYRGNVLVSDDGDGALFDLFYDQGRVVDIGTSYAMQIDEDEGYRIFVMEGTVDNYNGAILGLDRLKEGDLLAGKNAGRVSIERIAETPSWVAKGGARRELPGVETGDGPLKIQTTTWLRGRAGGGVASGSLAGVRLRVTSDACHNSGEVHPMRWTQHLNEFQPAEVWYHAECAAIGAVANPFGHLGATSVVVDFQDEVENPILFFGWGEASLKVDLGALKILDHSFFRSHPSIQFKDKMIDFGRDSHRQNIEGQVASVKITGKFGPTRPLVFDLVSSNSLPSSLSFSLGLVEQ